jgi:hemolysin III
MYWLGFREPISSWTHGLWMVCAVPGCLLLWRVCRGDRLKQFGLLLFGGCLVFCFGSSALYHGVCLPQWQIDTCRKLDHVGIFLLIAGTITPPALVLLIGPWRWGTLTLAWSMAGLGISLLGSWINTPLWVYTSLYLVMGWTVCVGYFEMARVLPPKAMRAVWIGGVLYTVGALLNAAGWPRPLPGIFGTHELFHLFVMAGSLCHFWFMIRWIAPFDRRQLAPARTDKQTLEIGTLRTASAGVL